MADLRPDVFSVRASISLIPNTEHPLNPALAGAATGGGTARN